MWADVPAWHKVLTAFHISSPISPTCTTWWGNFVCLLAGGHYILSQTPTITISAHHHQALLRSKPAGCKIPRGSTAFYGWWEDAQVREHWKGHTLDFLSFLLKRLWSQTVALPLTWRFLLSPPHSDPPSIDGWQVSLTQPHCTLWLGHSEDVDVQAEKESKARPSCFINTKMSSLFKHHADIFWTWIYEPVSTFPWLEKVLVVLWVQVGDMVSPEAQRRVTSLFCLEDIPPGYHWPRFVQQHGYFGSHFTLLLP